MTYLHALILGIIEGVSEFLPISSTGHLILTSHLLHLEQTDFQKSFEIAIQLGAILSVVVLYWRTLLVNFEILKRVITAFIPTAILGFVTSFIVALLSIKWLIHFIKNHTFISFGIYRILISLLFWFVIL